MKHLNKNLKTILITGTSGFLGQYLVKKFESTNKYNLRVSLRSAKQKKTDKVEIFANLPLDIGTDWSKALFDCQIVIHLAARAHVMKELASDPLAEYRKVNVDGTINLAKQAAALGVKRFIFLSSIKVNGESTEGIKPFSVDDEVCPVDPYGLSKFEAEEALLKLAKETGMEVVIIRPPLIYGPNVKGNFHQLLKIMQKPIPLPFKSVNNKRSFVGIDNLCSLIELCISHPKAANEVFLVSDNDDQSTRDLLEKIANASNKKAFLFPFPPLLLYIGACLLGKKGMYERLCNSLQVDISKTCELLDWQPPYSFAEGLDVFVRSDI